MCHGEPNTTYDKNWDCGLCNAELVVSQKKRMEYVRCFKKEVINKCPRCGSQNLDLKGYGESYYGRYQYYEWICEDCKYTEEQYYYDNNVEKVEKMKENVNNKN